MTQVMECDDASDLISYPVLQINWGNNSEQCNVAINEASTMNTAIPALLNRRHRLLKIQFMLITKRLERAIQEFLYSKPLVRPGCCFPVKNCIRKRCWYRMGSIGQYAGRNNAVNKRIYNVRSTARREASARHSVWLWNCNVATGILSDDQRFTAVNGSERLRQKLATQNSSPGAHQIYSLVYLARCKCLLNSKQEAWGDTEAQDAAGWGA
jgi:hypothetical protein